MDPALAAAFRRQQSAAENHPSPAGIRGRCRIRHRLLCRGRREGFYPQTVLGRPKLDCISAIVRGNVRIDADCSINPYAHIAGQVTIGRGCRIASLASIYGFNHGIARTDIFIKDQPGTYQGVILHEDIWVGANAVILDGVQIGAHCVIAAGAVVTKSFGECQIIGGNPARVISSRRGT